MDNQIGIGGFNILPKGVKNLLILNFLFFLATIIFQKTGVFDMNRWFGLHYIGASDFRPWQFITYMFMHANFNHIFWNMFALWMFGAAVENYWGTKRFLFYYFITGIGAAFVQLLVTYFQIHPLIALLNQFLNSPSLETYQYLVTHNKEAAFSNMLTNNLLVLQQNPHALNDIVNITANAKAQFLNSFNTIGASGAIFGLLLAFGMLFPNEKVYIYFLLPMKAKWFVLIYGLLELFFGLSGSMDNVAHYAHLGGMLFGIILILLWRKQEKNNRPNNNDNDYYDYEQY